MGIYINRVFLLVFIIAIMGCNPVTKPMAKEGATGANSDNGDSHNLVILEESYTDVSPTTVIVSWKLNRPADGHISYGISPSLKTEFDQEDVRKNSHSFTLTDLQSDTTYYYRLVSSDTDGNSVVLSNLSFKTSPEEFIITSQNITNITSTSVDINWALSKAANAQIEYGTTSAYGSITNRDHTLRNSHSGTLTDLKPDTYYVRLRSVDAKGATIISTGMIFKTLASRPAYENLLEELVGFGQETTGGKGGHLYTVTSLANSGAGSLREALAKPTPSWIRFAVSGTILLTSDLIPKSNTTIDGRGADITIKDQGIIMDNGISNIIINNIKLRDGKDDMIRMYRGGNRLWVHHCDLSNGADGAIDTTENVTKITISYNHIFDHDKAMLVGASSVNGDGESMLWTAHHNWYERATQRLPLIRLGKAHSFNNLINWHNGTAMDVGQNPAQLFSENDILRPLSGVNHKPMAISGGDLKITGAWERPYGSGVLNILQNNPHLVFDPKHFYSYTARPANTNLEAEIKAKAGWQNVPWPEELTSGTPTWVSAVPNT
jgi:pectate lyase